MANEFVDGRFKRRLRSAARSGRELASASRRHPNHRPPEDCSRAFPCPQFEQMLFT